MSRVDEVSAVDIKTFCSKKGKMASAHIVCLVKTDSKDHLDELICYYSDLTRLIKITSFIMSWNFFKFIRQPRAPTQEGRNQPLMQSTAVTATEYHDAWLYLIYSEQVKRLCLPVSVTTSLSKFRKTFQLFRLGGWTQARKIF